MRYLKVEICPSVWPYLLCNRLQDRLNNFGVEHRHFKASFSTVLNEGDKKLK